MLSIKKYKYVVLPMLMIIFFTERSFAQISTCYLTFKGTDKIIMYKQDFIKNKKTAYRLLQSSKGMVKISREEGARILYRLSNGVTFVNVKIERSDVKNYNNDKKNLIKYNDFLTFNMKGNSLSKLMNIKIDQYTLEGYTYDKYNKSNIISSYFFFPKTGVILYIDFYNPNLVGKNEISFHSFKELRDLFLKRLLAHISKSCN